jgi:hypothetical protein
LLRTLSRGIRAPFDERELRVGEFCHVSSLVPSESGGWGARAEAPRLRARIHPCL